MRSGAPLLAALVAGMAVTQEPTSTDGRRTCAIGRVAAAAAPVIDGMLDDACWAVAPAIGQLVMVEPVEGLAPTQGTTIKLLHDQNALYLALWCDDDDPASIRRTQRARDAQLDPDDRVEVLFDSFENRRTGYFFQVGAGGSIGDGLSAANGTRFEKPWDAIWIGEVKVTERGWQAELSIPFRSIPRKSGAADWGFNVRRVKRSTNEVFQWANPRQAVPFFRISELGRVRGIGEVDEGIGVDLVPYVAAGASRDRSAVEDDWRFDPDAGGDLFYRITPELTLAGTLFTDFAETENDSRQISLDRFPLFFPEKRDFFLEGSSYFTFGPAAQQGQAVLPFFSRRIGLSTTGDKIPVIAGLKLTGEAGPMELGLLDVVTDASGGPETRKNLAVARLKYSLAEQTTVGLIATNGRPELDGENQVLGFDFYHRVPQFVGDLDLQLFATAITTHTSGDGGDGESLGLEARCRGREWEIAASTSWVHPEFQPELGFVRRTDTKEWLFAPEFKPRIEETGAVRNLDFSALLRWNEGWDGGTQDLALALPFIGVEMHSGDRLGLTWARRFERVDADFTLFSGSTTIAAGDYWTTRPGIVFETSDGRDLSVSTAASVGDFYNGDSLEVVSTVAWRTGPLLHLEADYGTAVVDLGPGNSFTTRVVELRGDLFFDPGLSLRTLVLFDNESEELGWQSRLRWIYQPGCDCFLVIGAGWQRTDDGSFVAEQQGITIKVAHTLRF